MQQVVRTLARIGPMRLAAMGAVTLSMILFFVFITARLNSGDMKLLYADLTPQDSNAMVRELEAAQISYQMGDAGNSILVSAQEVGKARMLLASKGLPDGGSVGYEIFDQQSSIGSTRFEQDINQLRALEGELVRTIASLKPVENARVHLVLPRRELFNRDTRPATASVTLKLRVGKTLDDGQVSAIQHLVAAAVPQLEPQRVSIIDQSGTLLASGQVEANQDGAIGTNNVEKMRQQYEQRLVMAVDDMVGRIVGMGKVRTQVTADIDYDRESAVAEIFDPEQQVARSTQTVTEKEKTIEGATGGANNVSVQNNLPGLPTDAAAGGAGSSNDRTEETTNFEIGKTVKNSVREGGRVKQLSVAVLLDGTYETNKDGEAVYKPRTKAELDQIQTMVAAAIGFDKKRGDKLEVVNMQFAAPDLGLEEPLQAKAFLGLNKDDLFRAAEMLVLGLVAILVVLLVLRPLANRLMVPREDDGTGNNMGGFGGMDNMNYLGAPNQPAALTGPNTMPIGTLANDMPEAAGEESLIDLASVDGKVKASSVKKVSEIIDKHPNETVAVLRSWMFQEN